MKRPADLYAIRFVILIQFLWIAAAAAHAQHVVGAKAGIIQYTKGDVSLDGNQVKLSRGGYLQVHPGQSVRTELGLVEMLLSPEVYFRMGIFGLLRVEQNHLDDTRLALVQGSALIEIVQEIKGARTRVRLSKGDVEITKKGLYRLAAGSGEVRVYGGSALVSIASRKVSVKSGRMADLSADGAVKKFDAKELDSLHQWAARRSFELFQRISAPPNQNPWQRLSLGWAIHSDYRMRFFSDQLLGEWKLLHVPLDARIRAELDQARIQAQKEYLEQQAARALRELELSRK